MYIIDQNFIKKILEEWKIDFRIDENDHVTNEYAQKEIKKIVNDKIIPSMKLNINDYLGSKYNMEQQKALDTIFSMTVILYRLCESIYSYFMKSGKEIEKPDDELEVLSKLTANLLQNYKGSMNSYLADDFLTVIQKNRILYECYVVFMFVKKYPELARDFIDYVDIIKYQIVKNEWKNNISGSETIKKIESLKKNYFEQKGNNYGNYGWTNKVIPNDINRKFEYMVNDLKLDEKLGSVYKISSDYVHSNPYSAFIQPDRKMSICFIRISIDILVNQTSHFVERICNNKTYNTLINLLINPFKDKCLEVIDKHI